MHPATPTPAGASLRPALLRIALPVCWLVGLVACILLWNVYRSPEAFQNTPAPLLSVAELLGPVVYEGEPALEMRIRISRLAFVWTALCLAAWLLIDRRKVAAAWRAFIEMPAYPLSLAVFRIAVFYQISNIIWPELIVPVAALPQGLQYPLATGVPDIGFLSALAYWPPYAIPPEWVARMLEALRWVCWTGMLGLFSRVSALAAALLVTFGWGSIQWYGKVDHHHHLVWFALLLAASRCGDALSLDSLIMTWRRAGRGLTAPPPPGRAYGTPLALAMLLLGVAYFFPGFWKLWRSGLDWAFSDGPLYTLYGKWRMLGEAGLSTVDQHPLLLQFGSLGVLLLELSFWGLMILPVTRYLGAAAGLSFHLSGQITGRYGFESLMGCYVLFVPWGRLFRRLGSRLFPNKLRCDWTPASRLEAAALGVVRSLDLFGRVDWRDDGPPGLRVEQDRRSWSGRNAWLRLAPRLPLLWPTIPLLWAGLWRPLGGSGWSASGRPTAPGRAPVGAIVVAAALTVGNVWLGARRDMNGWPVACYPLFDGIPTGTTQSLRLIVQDESGEREWEPRMHREIFGNRWYRQLERTLRVDDPEEQLRRFRLIWELMTQLEPELRSATAVRFLSVESGVRPGQWELPPSSSRTLLELDLK